MANDPFLKPFLDVPLMDALWPSEGPAPEESAEVLRARLVDYATSFAMDVLRENKVKPIPAQADVRQVLDLAVNSMGFTAAALALSSPLPMLATLVGRVPQLLRAATPVREVLAKLIKNQPALQAMAAGVTIRPKEERWEPTDEELNYFASFSGDDLVTSIPKPTVKVKNPKFPLPARTQKIVEMFKKGPIPMTEDVSALKRRTQFGEAVQQYAIAWIGGKYRLAEFPPGIEGLRIRAALGTQVHNAIDVWYRAEHPLNVIVSDAKVYRNGIESPLSKYKDVDPTGADKVDVRLRMAYEAFMFYRGDDPAGAYYMRADLLDLTTLEVFEIKPRASAAKAALQSWLYKAGFNSAWAPYAAGAIDAREGFVRWGRGWPRTKLQIPLGQKYMAVVVAGKVPGLLLYDVFEKVPDDEEEKELQRRVWEEAVRRSIEKIIDSPRPVTVPHSPGQQQPVRPPVRVPGPMPSPGPVEGEPAKPPSWWPDSEAANDNQETSPDKGDKQEEQVAARDIGELPLLILLALIAILSILAGGIRIQGPMESPAGGAFPIFPLGNDPANQMAKKRSTGLAPIRLAAMVNRLANEIEELRREATQRSA